MPQFMAGLTMVLSGVLWIDGPNAALVTAPALGAASLLAFAA